MPIRINLLEKNPFCFLNCRNSVTYMLTSNIVFCVGETTENFILQK